MKNRVDEVLHGLVSGTKCSAITTHTIMRWWRLSRALDAARTQPEMAKAAAKLTRDIRRVMENAK